MQACLERRLLINCTHGTVIRLLPAMNLTPAEAEEGLRDAGRSHALPSGWPTSSRAYELECRTTVSARQKGYE